MLRRSGAAPAAGPSGRPSAEDLLLASFERYLLDRARPGRGHVVGYLGHARRFVSGFTRPGGLAAVSAGDVTAAVLAESAPVSVSAVQFFVSGLRSFLRFCFVGGAGAGRPVAGGPRRDRSPQGDAAARDQPGGRCGAAGKLRPATALGRRDYAIVITLLRLGLRAGEVAAPGAGRHRLAGRAELVVTGKGGRPTGCRCQPTRARRSPPISRGRPPCQRLPGGVLAGAGAVRPGHARAQCPRRCAAPAAGQGSRRWGRTGCATRRPARWCSPASRSCRSPRCCGTTVLQTTALYARVDAGRLRELARAVARAASRPDERAARARRGLPRGCAGRWASGWNAQAQLLPSSCSYLEAAGAADGHQQTSRSPGRACPRAHRPSWAQRLGHRPRLRRLPASGSTRPPRCRPRACSRRGGTAPLLYLCPRPTSAGSLEQAGTLRPPLRAATHETLFGLLARHGHAHRRGDRLGARRRRPGRQASSRSATPSSAAYRLVPLHPSGHRGAAAATPPSVTGSAHGPAQDVLPVQRRHRARPQRRRARPSARSPPRWASAPRPCARGYMTSDTVCRRGP